MKKLYVWLFLLLLLAACSDKTAELYDTAKFEELQGNRKHAVELYTEIVEKYPESKEAKDSAKRLKEIAEE